MKTTDLLSQAELQPVYNISLHKSPVKLRSPLRNFKKMFITHVDCSLPSSGDVVVAIVRVVLCVRQIMLSLPVWQIGNDFFKKMRTTSV